MIYEKVIGNIQTTDISKLYSEILFIDWHDIGRKLIRGVSSLNNEIGIKLETGINAGDILYKDQEKVIYVDVSPCELTRAYVSNITEMGRLCFELGNRHLSLSIHDTYVDVPYDTPTFDYLLHKGFMVEKINDKFTDFTICHGHDGANDHHHHH